MWQAIAGAIVRAEGIPESTQVEMLGRCSEQQLRAKLWKSRSGPEGGQESELDKFRREMFEDVTTP